MPLLNHAGPGRTVHAAVAALTAIVIGTALTRPSVAGDWPQILGPTRNGLAADETLAATWPTAGPKLLWKRDVGSGFSGIAVWQDWAVLFHRLDDNLVAEGLEAATGKPRWKVSFPTSYTSTISPDNGPRCVPLIAEGRVFLLGPAGELACVELSSGKKLWQRNLLDEFSAPEGYFGAGSTPILEDGKLLINVGGKGAGIVALNPRRRQDRLAGDRRSCQLFVAHGRHDRRCAARAVRHAAQRGLDRSARRQSALSVFIRWRGPTVNAANPLVLDGHVFVSSSYGVGAKWAKIGVREATTEWESDDVMSSQYTTCVAKDGYLYGIDGRQDIGVARLRCIDPKKGQVLWTKEQFGTGSLILADGKLLIMKTDGELVLAEPSPQRFQPLATAQVLDTTVQALPALAAGRLFVRDTKTLKCLSVGK